MVKGFGVDDWLMFGATIAFILLAACILTGIHYGTGRHSWDLTAYGEIMARQVSLELRTPIQDDAFLSWVIIANKRTAIY